MIVSLKPKMTAEPSFEPNFPNHQGLVFDEALIFERESTGTCGVDFDEISDAEFETSFLGACQRKDLIGLPNLSEPEVVRHFTRLSQKNFSIDSGMYPLGSCTMKHNPRLNEKMARMSGFSALHPLQPEGTIQGALELIYTLQDWLVKLTGMADVCMSPAAGAHGELCGMMAIKTAIEAKGEHRPYVLVPESAHGTNPATAAACGFEVRSIPAGPDGKVNLAAFREALRPDVAAIMLTNPNTCGLFENDIITIAEEIHKIGAYFYCDGANFNAIVGRVRPGDLGIDAMHLNLHKTFSTPHGGGGPGAGPVVLSERLAPYALFPKIVKDGERYRLVEAADSAFGTEHFLGRLKGFHGQMGMFVRALTYMMSHGADGLHQASGDAVLNANYIKASLSNHFSVPFKGVCMHEVLFDDKFLKGTGVSTLDFAKALIDYGFHPMTMYFPLVVTGAMLIEPTETETKQTLDHFIHVMKSLADLAVQGSEEDREKFHTAPHFTQFGRFDETKAAREPILTYQSRLLNDRTL